MGKRSNKPRVDRDFYPTPEHAVMPLLQHLPPDGCDFDEPCAGDGALVNILDKHGYNCSLMSDIRPEATHIITQDVFDIEACLGDCFITNPPYTWAVLDRMITHLSDIAPTWLLLPADMMHNKRMAKHIKRCEKIVSIGRVKWFGNMAGMENSAWYQFTDHEIPTTFYGRI